MPCLSPREAQCDSKRKEEKGKKALSRVGVRSSVFGPFLLYVAARPQSLNSSRSMMITGGLEGLINKSLSFVGRV